MKYMKKLSLFILACICTLGSYADDVAVFNALVNRLLPNYSSQITGKKLPEGKNDYLDIAWLSSDLRKLKAGTPVAW